MEHSKIVGIKGGYPRVPLGVRVKAYVQLLRPMTCLVVLLGGLTTTLMAAGYNNDFSRLFDKQLVWFYGIGTLLLIQFGSNALNQGCDVVEDGINKPYRPVPTKRLGVNEVKTFAVLAFVLALFRASMVNEWFGFFCVVLIVLTILYSMEPVRFKKRLGWSNGVLGVARGGVGYLACWSILFDPMDIPAMVGALILTVYVAFAWISKDFGDTMGDVAAGNRNLVTCYGEKLASNVMFGGIVVSGVLFIVVGLLGALKLGVVVLGGIGIVYVVWMKLKSNKLIVQDKWCENVGLWKHATILLAIMQVGLAIIYVGSVMR